MELEEAIEKLNYLKTIRDLKDYVKDNNCMLADAIEVALNQLTKQDKMIDEMIKVMSDRNICKYFIENYCKHYAGENKKTCDVCIKQYFEKKAEE